MKDGKKTRRQVAMTTSMQSPRRDFEINVLGSINVLEAVRQYSPGTAIIYASSNKVYGNLEHLDLIETETRYTPRVLHRGIDESTAIEFHTTYGCSKGAADQYTLDYARGFGLNTVVFRHSTIYGGRQFATSDQGWVGWFCRQALESRVRCYALAYEHIGAARGQAFNVGGGIENSMSILELLNFLENRLSIKLNYSHIPWRQSDQKFFVADNSKAERIIHWSPRTIRDDGLETVLQWEQETLTI
jgi:CDP-paratose 2-epimerase